MSTPQYILGEQRATSPLDNYYLFKQEFNAPELTAIHALADGLEQEKGIAGNGLNPEHRVSDISWLMNAPEKSDWLYAKVATLFQIANQQMWNVDISTISDAIQYTRYDADKKGHYDFHLDVGEQSPRRKLSMSIVLDDPKKDFEGGEFEIKCGMTPMTVELNKGDVVIFPSFLLHRVRKVTKGTRRSLVSWAAGPIWR